MSIRRTAKLFALVLTTASASGMTSTSCPYTVDAAALADAQLNLSGVWTISRIELRVTYSWTVDNGGDLTREYAGLALEPLDRAQFPTALDSLIQHWNIELGKLNARLDAALPGQILLGFPRFSQIRVTDPGNASLTLVGAINSDDEFIFVGDLTTGGGTHTQAAGVELKAATLEGKIDRAARTLMATMARTLIVFNQGSPSEQTAGGHELLAKIILKVGGEMSGPLP